jgi:hypothetical protein
MATLWDSSSKCDGLKKECEGTLSFFVYLLLYFFNSVLILHYLFLLLLTNTPWG